MSEYQSMLVAAGWVQAADFDNEYQEYLRRVDDPMAYEAWKSVMCEFEQLNKRWDAEVQPHLYARAYGEIKELSVYVQTLADELAESMSELEWVLAY